ncbi:MAG: hypothetical protein LBD59_07650 [Prevotellaceae bacterium]|jgi:uncharacterized protein YcgI (DUF1989 family)|nr:hypothetical protein [Prevotellaceae bacterium]
MSKRKFLSFKPIAGTILGLAILAITGFNIHLVMEGQKDFFSSNVTDKRLTALSQENGTEILQRIRTSCNCRTRTNYFVGISILSCEDYVWCIPLTRLACALTNCPDGAYCN